MRSYEDLLKRQRRLNHDAAPPTVLHMGRKDHGRRRNIYRAVAATVVVMTVFAMLLVLCGRSSDLTSKDEEIPAEEELPTETEKMAITAVEEAYDTESHSAEGVEAELIVSDIYRASIPLSFDEQIALYNASQEFGVDYFLMVALIHRETNFRNIPGDGGESIGYAQIQPKWWGELMAEIGAEDLTDPEDNFRTACAILATLAERYGSIEDALTAYNRGTPGFSQYAKTILVNAEHWREAAND